MAGQEFASRSDARLQSARGLAERCSRQSPRWRRIGWALLLLGVVVLAVSPWGWITAENPAPPIGMWPVIFGAVLLWWGRRSRAMARAAQDAFGYEPLELHVQVSKLPGFAQRPGLSIALGPSADKRHPVKLGVAPFIEPADLRAWPPTQTFSATVWSSFKPGDAVIIIGDGRGILGRVATARTADPAGRFAAWCLGFGLIFVPVGIARQQHGSLGAGIAISAVFAILLALLAREWGRTQAMFQAGWWPEATRRQPPDEDH